MKPFYFVFVLFGCQPDPKFESAETEDTPNIHPIAMAAVELTKTAFVTYDPSYQSIPYPMGDVAPNRGVCADVVIRALRKCGMDLQKLVHEDMTTQFSAYPKKWGLSRTDRNIDHRRVPNLMRYFERKLYALSLTQDPKDYLPGDIVAWDINGNGLTHIGIVIPSMSNELRPWIVHNIGYGQVAQDVLFQWKIIGHYRLHGPEYEKGFASGY